MRIGRRITAAILCAMMLLSSVSAADFPLNRASLEKLEAAETMPNQIAEGIAQEAAATGDTEPLESSTESQNEISTYDVRNPPLTEYDLVKCTGYIKLQNNMSKQVTETFRAQGGAGHAAFTLENKYIPGLGLTFTFYKYGNGTYGFDPSDNYTNGGSGASHKILCK